MPENDSISYFSSLGFARAGQVRVAPAVKSNVKIELPELPAANTVSATSESGTDANPDKPGIALQADTLTLSKQVESLSSDDLRLIQKLASRDREVRAHEAAHLAAAGRFARGGANFSYQRGPNGVNYAIGGEVSLDTSAPSDPQAALTKAEIIRRAALAPAKPSAQDRAVAGQAAQMAVQARAAIASDRAEEVAEALDGGEEKEATRQATEENSEGPPLTPTGIQAYQNNTPSTDTESNERIPSLRLEA